MEEQCPIEKHEKIMEDTREKVIQIEIGQARLFEKLDSLVNALLELKDAMKQNEIERKQDLKDYAEDHRKLEERFNSFEKETITVKTGLKIRYWCLILMLLVIIGLSIHQIVPTVFTGSLILKIV